MRKTSRVRNICNVAVLFILALSISLFGCNNNTPVEGRGNLNIIVSDQASKTVAYEPADGYPSAMSHYTVVVKDSGGETVGTSGYMALENGEGRFEVTNLITGSYTVNVSGYVQTAADEYTLIATGSETATVNASYANDLVVAIDTFDDAYTGNITVELTMPIDAIVNNTISGNLSWTLTAIDDSGMSFNGSETLTAIALVDWKHTLTIADKKVPAGRYLLTVTFDNGSSYSAIDAVIAYPGLPSTGVINLDSRKPSSYEFTVTDMIGDELKPAGDGVYSAESDSFVVTLSTTLGENETPLWFVDGMVVEVTDNGDVSYTLTGLDDGRRNVTMVVYDDGFKSVIGSLMFVVEIEAESDIGAVAPDEVTVEYYDLAKNLQLGDNEINMGFTKDGVDVEFPYTGAIVAKDITSGTSVTYEMLGLQPITRKFSEYFVEDEYKEGKYYIASEAKFGEIFSSHYLMLPPIVKDFDFFSYLLEFAYTRGNNSLNLKEIVTSISYDDMLNQADNGFAKLRDIVELEFNSDNIKNCDNQSFSIRSLSSEDSNALSFIHSPADTSEFNRFHRMYQDFAFGYMEFNPEMHSLDIFYIPQSVVEEYTHEGNQGLRLKAGFVSFDNLYLFSFCDPYFYESQEYPLLNVKDNLPEDVQIWSAIGDMDSSEEDNDYFEYKDTCSGSSGNYQHATYYKSIFNISFEDGVTTIPASLLSFENIGGSNTYCSCSFYSAIQNLSLPSTLRNIGDSAFRGVSWVDSPDILVIPDGVESIEDYAFGNVGAGVGDGLSDVPIGYPKRIFVPKSVTDIGKRAFCANTDCILYVEYEEDEIPSGYDSSSSWKWNDGIEVVYGVSFEDFLIEIQTYLIDEYPAMLEQVKTSIEEQVKQDPSVKDQIKSEYGISYEEFMNMEIWDFLSIFSGMEISESDYLQAVDELRDAQSFVGGTFSFSDNTNLFLEIL